MHFSVFNKKTAKRLTFLLLSREVNEMSFVYSHLLECSSMTQEKTKRLRQTWWMIESRVEMFKKLFSKSWNYPKILSNNGTWRVSFYLRIKGQFQVNWVRRWRTIQIQSLIPSSAVNGFCGVSSLFQVSPLRKSIFNQRLDVSDCFGYKSW